MRYLGILFHFLCHKLRYLVAILFSIRKSIFHVDFVAISFDPAPKGGVHMLHCFHVSRCNQYKITGNRLGSHHGPGASLALASYCEFSFLHC